jgi:hypothetical protein
MFRWLSLGTAVGRPTSLSAAIRAARARGSQWTQPIDETTLPIGALPLSAGIFHVSRCGSTLVANVLDRLHMVQLADELQAPLDILGPYWRPFPVSRQLADLDLTLALLGQPLTPDKRALIMKFSSSSLTGLSLLEKISPGMRKVMIFRDPLEVLISNLRTPPPWSAFFKHPIRAALYLGLRPSLISGLTLPDFIARALARDFTLAADAVSLAPAEWLLIDYADMPDAIFGDVLPWLGLVPQPDELAGLVEETRLYSKRRDEQTDFVPDGMRKQADASLEERALCERWLREPYGRLRQLHAMRDGIAIAGADPRTMPPESVEHR